MLKMIKYEYRRIIGFLGIVFGSLVVLEILFLLGSALDMNGISAFSFAVLTLEISLGYIVILSAGIKTYSDDLKKKEGYLVFMTPISSYGILAAKMISTFLAGVSFVVISVIFEMINFDIIGAEFNIKEFMNFVAFAFKDAGIDYRLAIFIAFLLFLIAFYMIITMAYFAISISATILQNKKGKGIISVVIFVVFYIIITIVADAVKPDVVTINNFSDAMLSVLPQYIVYLTVAVLSYFGAAYLLDKKISL